MRQRTFQRRALIFVMLLGGALLPYLVLWGCGSSNFGAPATTSAPALLSSQTLKTWMDQGKVNGEGYDRVVILDVTSPGDYDNTTKGHIPGAQLVNFSTDLIQTRIEGIAPAFGMILDGSRMDALIQKLGIDRNTTIVFTSSTSLIYATRAYFTFRYWGFPKKCLKVLDGANAAWNADFAGSFTTDHPVVAASAYSVRNLGALNAGLRASLGEMMTVAADTDPDTIIVDARSGETAGCFAGIPRSTSGVFAPGGDYAVFEGHMKGGRALGHTSLTASGRFLPVDNLVALFGAIGVDSTKTAYVYCRTGVIASVEFFVLDGILGWDTVLYDGSWSQWGAMGVVDKGGPLAATSPWRTDTSAYSDLIVYNQDNGALVEKVVLDDLAVQMYTTVGDPSANQIEKEDAGYLTGGGGASGGGTTTGGGSGGGC